MREPSRRSRHRGDGSDMLDLVDPSPSKRFDALRVQRRHARSVALDGRLSEEEEARFAEEMDDCWNAMNEGEREEAERSFRATKEGK